MKEKIISYLIIVIFCILIIFGFVGCVKEGIYNYTHEQCEFCGRKDLTKNMKHIKEFDAYFCDDECFDLFTDQY